MVRDALLFVTFVITLLALCGALFTLLDSADVAFGLSAADMFAETLLASVVFAVLLSPGIMVALLLRKKARLRPFAVVVGATTATLWCVWMLAHLHCSSQLAPLKRQFMQTAAVPASEVPEGLHLIVDKRNELLRQWEYGTLGKWHWQNRDGWGGESHTVQIYIWRPFMHRPAGRSAGFFFDFRIGSRVAE